MKRAGQRQIISGDCLNDNRPVPGRDSRDRPHKRCRLLTRNGSRLFAGRRADDKAVRGDRDGIDEVATGRIRDRNRDLISFMAAQE